jgi:hypothetical protein
VVKEIVGPSGVIKWGYRPVATLKAWRFTAVGLGGTFTAEIATCDEFALQRQPLVVVVPAGASFWKWPVRDLVRDGLNVTMTVGSLE